MVTSVNIGKGGVCTVTVEWDSRWSLWYVCVKSQENFHRRSSSGYFSHINPAFRERLEKPMFRHLWEAVRSARRTQSWLQDHSVSGPEWVLDRFHGQEYIRRRFDPHAWKRGISYY